MPLSQTEVIEAVQSLIAGDAASRAQLVKLFPLGVRFLMTRYPMQELVSMNDNLSADGDDWAWCPDDFDRPVVLWTAKQEKAVDIITPTQFGTLLAQDYSGTEYFACLYVDTSGRYFFKFIPNIGTGTAITLHYLQKPSVMSADFAPDYLAEALILWLKMMVTKDKGEKILARKDFRKSTDDLVAMQEATPGETIRGIIPADYRLADQYKHE